jgi:hypothetical protein
MVAHPPLLPPLVSLVLALALSLALSLALLLLVVPVVVSWWVVAVGLVVVEVEWPSPNPNEEANAEASRSVGGSEAVVWAGLGPPDACLVLVVLSLPISEPIILCFVFEWVGWG